ncbi:MAG: ABC transporter permease [ANME-2 cluster archaeon]|nr:ABC transporter permease [ANME-2 cluster archaeon]
MFFNLLFSAIRRRKLRIALAVLAVVMGASIATSLLTVSFDINEKMGRELKSYGANILLLPSSEAAFIREDGLYKMKTIFWRHNILGYSPYLSDDVKINGEEIALSGTYFEEMISVPGEDEGFTTGVKSIAPWWDVEGDWPKEGEALIGVSVADKLNLKRGGSFRAEFGDSSAVYNISGILSTGGEEDHQVIVPLKDAQELFSRKGMVDRVVVSALTTPEPDKKIDPDSLPPEEYEIWYCTPYISSIMLQLEEAVPDASAKPIRQVADNEGKLLGKFQGLMFLITAVAMISASIGVTAAMNTSIFERRKEIGLMKAIGADSVQISRLFLAEAAVIGIAGGAVGSLIGTVLARMIGVWVFGAHINLSPVPFLISGLLSVGVALLGGMLPVKQAVEIEPSTILKGD